MEVLGGWYLRNMHRKTPPDTECPENKMKARSVLHRYQNFKEGKCV